MATVKLQDNLPITGRLEKVWYQPPKEYGAQLKLVGRWQEHTPTGVVERGPGNLYVNIDLENDLRILGVVEVGTDASSGEPTYRVLKPGPIRILKAPTGEGNKRRTTITLVEGTAPTASVPVSAGPASPAAPAPTASAPGDLRKQQFADWLAHGDALAAGLALAKHAADIAGVPTTPESLQAGAATLLIRAERTGLQAWRGLGKILAEYLAQHDRATPPIPPPGTTPRPAVARQPVGAGAPGQPARNGIDPPRKADPGFDEFPEALGEDDELPFS